MRLQLLLTAGLVLFLSALASPNECVRSGHKSAVKPAPRTVTAESESSTLMINTLLYI